MSLDEDMRNALKTFVIESLELLQDMEERLLVLEEEADSAETVNAIFRAAHTIKGSAGLFGLDHIVAFTHVVESVLDSLRDGKLQISGELIAALLPCCDHIMQLVHDVEAGQESETAESAQTGQTLLDGLRPFLAPKPESIGATAEHAVVSATVEGDKVQSIGGGRIDSGNWHLSLRFGPDCLRDGMDPLSFVRYLGTLGQVVGLTTICNAIPPAAEMDPETCYLGFEIEFKSGAAKEEIENVFEFVRDSSTIRILPLESGIDEFIALINELPEDATYLGEILVKSGAVTKRELQEALERQQAEKRYADSEEATLPVLPIGEILVAEQRVRQPVVNAALEKQKQIKENKNRENQSIRVDAERLDKLIDLIGELVIASAAVNLRAEHLHDTALQEAGAGVMGLVEAVRDSALQLRMVPIGTTFSRFQRVVRDVSKELGKDIKLVISGADTEVDKSVVEKIGDPLMHLVRNAMDHGIERAELRAERGKPAQGTLQLNAYHSSGNIVIEVSDDGGGLNRDKIFAKAVERGLVQASDTLSDQDIYALIFEPGFSTADQISNLSGRGVGMDVVKSNINALRGRIDVESQFGFGSTMRIYLPLTLAIIDGFMVGVGTSTFIIPVDRILECVALSAQDRDRPYVDLRGEVLPLVRLRSLFEIVDETPARENIVVVEHAGNKAGFIVDRLLGEFQTVIKPLSKLFAHINGVAGSTILGTGKVALILDVPSLVDYAAAHSLVSP